MKKEPSDLRDRIPPFNENWGEFGKEIESANSFQLFAIIGWSVLASATLTAFGFVKLARNPFAAALTNR